jgi:hypothetical protein
VRDLFERFSVTIFLSMVIGAALLALAGLVGYLYCDRLHRRSAQATEPIDEIPAPDIGPIDHVIGHVMMDCRSCGKNNRVTYARLLKRPTCGLCKLRLLPRRRVVFQTLRNLSDERLDRELNTVWSDYDKIWSTLHRGLFGIMSGAKKAGTDEATN